MQIPLLKPKSTLLTQFFRNNCFTKKACRLTPTYKFELCISWFSINHRNTRRNISIKMTDVLQLTHDAIVAVTEDD